MRDLLLTGAQAGWGLVTLGLGRLVATWAIAKWQGPIVQGAFGLATACISFGAILLAFGTDYANAYVVGRNQRAVRRVVVNSIALSVVALFGGLGWVFAFTRLFPAVLGGTQPTLPVLMALGAGTAATVALMGLQGAAIGTRDIRGVSFANAIAGTLWLTAATLAARFGDYLGLLISWVAVQAGVVWFQAARLLRRSERYLRMPGVLAQQLRFGLVTLPGGVARALNMRIALYLASVFVIASDLGVFVLYLSIAEAMLYIPNGMSQVILARVARREPSALTYRLPMVLVLSVGLLAALAAAVFGRVVLAAAIGPEYGAKVDVLAVVLLATTAHSVGILRVHELIGNGRPGLVSIAQLLALVTGASTAALLIPRHGVMGGALSMLAAYTLFAAFLVGHSGRGASGNRPEMPALLVP